VSAKPLDRAELTPSEIDEWRKIWMQDVDSHVPALRDAAMQRLQLCELALDGLRFRVWCEGATPGGGICTMASLLAKCVTPQMYREAIDKFIVMRAQGKVQKP
jgi:hypothetical protein